MTIDERTSGGVTILDVRGRITIEVVGDMLLANRVRELVKQGHTQVVLNLEDVPYVDSTGLSNIVKAYVTATRQAGALKLLNPNRHVRELLTVTKLSTVLDVYDSEADAVASCKPSASI